MNERFIRTITTRQAQATARWARDRINAVQRAQRRTMNSRTLIGGCNSNEGGRG
jgi:hypothetical protein